MSVCACIAVAGSVTAAQSKTLLLDDFENGFPGMTGSIHASSDIEIS
jgi:hypothetical protein